MDFKDAELADLMRRLATVYENGDLKPAGFAHLWDWIGKVIIESRCPE